MTVNNDDCYYGNIEDLITTAFIALQDSILSFEEENKENRHKLYSG
jgi:hypothetical protein